VGRNVLKLVKFLLRILLKTALGAVAITVLNLVGQFFGLHAPLNIVSSLSTGLLGLLGLILLIVFSSIL
jgi:inhibitor of the pro-sigma K processing machinery